MQWRTALLESGLAVELKLSQLLQCQLMNTWTRFLTASSCSLRPSTQFQVDFQCGCCQHPRPDIAFQFNPRFYTVKPHVICNTLQGGLWQKEVRWPGVTLQRGASFLILFLFENEEVKVSVNGRHFLHYRYQLPLSRVDTLGIYGDVLVKAVGFLNINVSNLGKMSWRSLATFRGPCFPWEDTFYGALDSQINPARWLWLVSQDKNGDETHDLVGDVDESPTVSFQLFPIAQRLGVSSDPKVPPPGAQSLTCC
ncbi:hypothetical protein NN561_004324 [Cricetulus griseus]